MKKRWFLGIAGIAAGVLSAVAAWISGAETVGTNVGAYLGLAAPVVGAEPPRNLQPLPNDCVKRALLIGVNKYEKFNGLEYAVANCELIRSKLLELGFKSEHIVSLTSGGELEPTKMNIEEQIDALLAASGPDDMIFIQFSGHGFELDGTVCFAPKDARPTAPDDARVVRVETTVSITKLLERLKESSAKFKWVVVDACREKPTKTKSAAAARRALKNIDPPPGVAVFQSCASGEFSYEDDANGCGLFTGKLAEALSGKADVDQDGAMTALDVFKYASEQTKAASVGFETRQTPYFRGDFTDFVIADDLLIEGLTRADWTQANDLYKEACLLRRQKKNREALSKIGEARKINKTNENYKTTEEDLTALLAAEKAQAAQKLADEAYTLFEAGNYSDALKKMDESLALVDSATNRRLKKSIESKLNGGGTTSSGSSDSWTGTKAGELKTLKIKGVEYRFHWAPPCPEGFLMGSPEDEEGRLHWETQHTVKLSRGFWILETEVTQAMQESVTGDNPSYFKGSALPAESVSWENCRDFVKTVNSSGALPSGLRLSLPTEAQWEYACRAGTSGAYFWGSSLNGDKANCDGNYPCGTTVKGAYLAKTAPVGSYSSNAWGLYDMYGNVYEWCEDWIGDYPSGTVSDPTGPTSGSYRVLRGGGWGGRAQYCRSANRDFGEPTLRNSRLGFRPVLVSSSK